MKKLLIISLTLTLLIGAGSAWADVYTFYNNTMIEAYRYTSPYLTQLSGSDGTNYTPVGSPITAMWYDRIGTFGDFETGSSAFPASNFNTENDKLTIYTNWGSSGVPGNSFKDLGAVAADLFITITSGSTSSEYAIRLTSLNSDGTTPATSMIGNVYDVGTFKTSQNIFGGTGYIYGGLYDINNPTPTAVPVWGTGSKVNTVGVTWSLLSGDPQSVTVDLTNLLGQNAGNYDWSFIWGTGTCANDVIANSFKYEIVPIPGSVLLLGTGLLGLGGLRWRRRKSNA